MTHEKPLDGASTGPAPGADVARLCALYDGLLTAGGAPVSPDAEKELKALAKIFDLDAERPAAELWPYVRAVLVRQTPALDRMPVEPAATTEADTAPHIVPPSHRRNRTSALTGSPSVSARSLASPSVPSAFSFVPRSVTDIPGTSDVDRPRTSARA